MMNITLVIILLIVVAAAAAVVTLVVVNMARRKQADKIIRDAEIEGENIKKEKIFQAKEKFLQLKGEHERYINEKNAQIQQTENKLKQREMQLKQQLSDLQRRQSEAEGVRENLKAQMEVVNRKSEEYDRLHKEAVEKIESLAGISAAEARDMLVETMKEEAKTQAMSYINDVMDEARMNASKEAKRVVINTIQRVAPETAIENAVTVFNIENDEMKGRIIGREGRNIRALEAATGVEIVVDDTPEAILLSAFDPVRREVARLALHQLVTDGRIHPARIEEVVEKVRKQLDDEIMETGKRTCIDLGIHGLHAELVKLVGRMKYRSSYGQNLLQHSREVANICATMAAELGLNPKLAKRAGLLHDIGKVPIVLVGDAISGARPGARREVIESYIKRLKDMEAIALSYPGVTKTYAIQAGRELRVIVGADQVSDVESEKLSNEIARKIQNEMVYPGQVKITVIRETRSVAFAK